MDAEHCIIIFQPLFQYCEMYLFLVFFKIILREVFISGIIFIPACLAHVCIPGPLFFQSILLTSVPL